MHNFVFGQKVEGLSYLVDHGAKETRTFLELTVEWLELYHIQLIVFLNLFVPVFFVDIVQHVPQRALTILIDDKSPRINNRIGKHL